MADERLRIVIDYPYLMALGRCLFVFAQLEWNVVWCGEKIDPGFLAAASGKMAGTIGADFEALVAGLSGNPKQARTLAAAKEFRRLVRMRNGIMHGKPCHSASGMERLTRQGQEWSIPELEAAADEFATCSIELNDLLHNVLP
jgi:hypothetical protein